MTTATELLEPDRAADEGRRRGFEGRLGPSPEEPAATTSRLRHIPALDGLRGVAVVVVLLFHAGHLRGGYLGVDHFFVLSGYLITSLLVLEWHQQGHVSLRRFWGRRARRLLPALLAMLAAVGVAAHWEVLPAARGQLRTSGFSTLAYVANWSAIRSAGGYWNAALQPSWLEHTWSLAIEEQFYLVWPLVAVGMFMLVTRMNRQPTASRGDRHAHQRAVQRLGTLAGVGAVVSGTTMIVWSWLGGSVERLYLGTDTRAAAIMLGAWLACRQRSAELDPRSRIATVNRGRGRQARAALVAAAGLAVAWTRLGGTDALLYRGGLLLSGVATTVIIADITTPGSSPLGRLLGIRPLAWLGTISYGLYLWHWPIFQYLYPGRFGLDGWTLVAVRLGSSLAVAAVSMAVLERPVRRGWSPRIAGVVLPIGVGVAVVALLVGTSGAVDLAPQSNKRTASVASASKPGDPTVLVVGDSVAGRLAEDGLIPAANEGAGLRVVDRAELGCTLLVDAPVPGATFIHNCSPSWPAAVREVRPDVVMVLFGGFVANGPVIVDGRRTRPCETAFQRFWERRLGQGVDELGASGAKVVLVTAPTSDAPLFKGKDPERFDREEACANSTLDRVAARRRNVSVIDLARWVCPGKGPCPPKRNGIQLRPDAVHFAGPGARLVADWLVPKLIAAGPR